MSDAAPVTDPRLPPPLTGTRVRLRAALPGDVTAITEILSDPTVRRWWSAHDPAAEARDLVEPEANRLVWVIEAYHAIVGVIQAWEEPDPDYHHAGIDLSLRAGAQGRGLGPDAIRTVAGWLFDTRGHHRLTIDPRADNGNAIRAYAKVGFRPVGVMRAYERDADGRWHDGLLMDLLAGELLDG